MVRPGLTKLGWARPGHSRPDQTRVNKGDQTREDGPDQARLGSYTRHMTDKPGVQKWDTDTCMARQACSSSKAPPWNVQRKNACKLQQSWEKSGLISDGKFTHSKDAFITTEA